MVHQHPENYTSFTFKVNIAQFEYHFQKILLGLESAVIFKKNSIKSFFLML